MVRGANQHQSQLSWEFLSLCDLRTISGNGSSDGFFIHDYMSDSVSTIDKDTTALMYLMSRHRCSMILQAFNPKWRSWVTWESIIHATYSRLHTIHKTCRTLLSLATRDIERYISPSADYKDAITRTLTMDTRTICFCQSISFRKPLSNQTRHWFSLAFLRIHSASYFCTYFDCACSFGANRFNDWSIIFSINVSLCS